MKFNRSQFMRNWWAAKLCRGCNFAYIGRKVGHNHCDHRMASHWENGRVNGRYNHPENMYHNQGCNYFNDSVA